MCEALLRGSGPLKLADITEALGTGDAAALRVLDQALAFDERQHAVEAALRVDAAEAVAGGAALARGAHPLGNPLRQRSQ